MSVPSSAVERNLDLKIDSEFGKRVSLFAHDLQLIERDIPNLCRPSRDDAIHHRLLEACESSIEDCRGFEASAGQDPTALAAAQAFFRTETDPWFRQSWFAHRARTKPSGFAGDFDMLCKIYGDPIPSAGIGAYLDLMFLDLPLACAVRGRL